MTRRDRALQLLQGVLRLLVAEGCGRPAYGTSRSNAARLVLIDEHLKAERFLKHGRHFGDGSDSGFDGTGEAGLGGDDEGQRVLGVAGGAAGCCRCWHRPLQASRDGRDDAGLVLHDEAKIPGGHELTGDGALLDR